MAKILVPSSDVCPIPYCQRTICCAPPSREDEGGKADGFTDAQKAYIIFFMLLCAALLNLISENQKIFGDEKKKKIIIMIPLFENERREKESEEKFQKFKSTIHPFIHVTPTHNLQKRKEGRNQRLGDHLNLSYSDRFLISLSASSTSDFADQLRVK